MPFDSRETARSAKAALAERLSGIGGITSLGIGKSASSGRYIVRVTVEAPAVADLVPRESEGVEVEVSVSGEFKAQ